MNFSVNLYSSRKAFAAVFFLVAVVLSSEMCIGQGAKPRPAGAAPRGEKDGAGNVLKIRKFFGMNKQYWERSPEYRTSSGRGPTKPLSEWPQIVVLYDTDPDWIDELTFQYYVLAVKNEAGKKVYTIFRATIHYLDIQKEKNHTSSVFLRPVAVRRYGQIVAAAVEIAHEGKVVAEESEADGKDIPDKWWKSQDNKNVTIKDGYLLDRSQSPFALINVDDYEVAK